MPANPYITKPYDDLRSHIEQSAGVTIDLVTMTEADGWLIPEVWGTASRESSIRPGWTNTVASELGANEFAVLDKIAAALGVSATIDRLAEVA